MKKKIIIVLLIISIIAITINYTIITTQKNKTYNNNIKIIEQNSNHQTELKKLNYSKNDIESINKYVSRKNIDYIIKNKISNKIAIGFINEKYYIDDYLKKYLNFYDTHSFLPYYQIIKTVNTHTDNPFYTNVLKADPTTGKYILINKYYKADKNYAGKKLIEVSKKYNMYNTSFHLSEECFEAFLKLYNDALKEGKEFKIYSAYRSYNYQNTVYNEWIKKDGKNIADTYSARAGHSEHQTGFAFDISEYPKTKKEFKDTKTFKWIKENAYKYGFIIRFPEGKELITGYQYEPWHLRYCGIECATYIYKNNITYEEYYEYFIKYKNPKKIK